MSYMLVWCPFSFEEGRNLKVKVRKGHCDGCIWLSMDGLFPFVRCIQRYGWTAEEVGKVEQKADRRDA